MNVNEVIANRAIGTAGGILGSKFPIHPNDDVYMSQSSNDAFTPAMHIASALKITKKLLAAVHNLRNELNEKVNGVGPSTNATYNSTTGNLGNISNTTASSTMSGSGIKTSTYGPDLNSPITGTYHAQGPIFVETTFYLIRVEV